MAGERFLSVALDPDALGHPDVVAVLAAEDDVADLVLTLISPDLPPGHRAGAVLAELRERGLQLALTAGGAGLAELLIVERLHPDLITLPVDLVRGLHQHRVRQRLVDVVVEIADDSGAATLAEEVESLDETQVLRTLGVRMANGWLFGRARTGFPPPPTEVCEWLRLQQLDLR
jgi:EAL domain-containing protein (putative c-di-GMP-specific phosphodiesterase class I)